jgi:hypothetical protein
VWANLPLGACCFDSGNCEDLMVTQCDDAGADFIGAGTTCATTNCRAPVAAPLLSAAGVVAAAAGLLGVSALRMLGRRRSGERARRVSWR